MSVSLDRIASRGVSLAAIAIAVVLVHREFFNDVSAGPSVADDPVFVEDWENWLSEGLVIGHETAPIKIIEFVDVQCPFCGTFHQKVMRPLRDQFGSSIAHVIVHLPLRMHTSAVAGGVALECAGRQGSAQNFIDVVFSQQDSVGTKSWEAYAADAGIADLKEFSLCIENDSMAAHVEQVGRSVKAAGIHATPTIMVNGWMYPMPPSFQKLSRIADALIADKNPF